MYTTLISAADLSEHIHQPNWIVVDCRFNLADPGAGLRAYLESHIPGAFYAHLEEDLSAPVVPGKTGRHPLPSVETVAALFSHWGIGPEVQVVAYDDMSGAIAARLWWMLRWLGHDAVAVLNGGWPAWEDAGLPTEARIPSAQPAKFIPHLRPEMLIDADRVEVIRKLQEYKVVDSRTSERYRGEVEPIDPVAGHIPGAVNIPHPDNVSSNGQWLGPEALRRQFLEVLGDTPAGHTAFYCGSGVTACRNILAYKHAGLGDALLYPGSWSEWIVDADRAVAIGG